MRGAVGRLGLQRGLDQLRHAFMTDRARLALADVGRRLDELAS
jgi:hypothetical protein